MIVTDTSNPRFSKKEIFSSVIAKRVRVPIPEGVVEGQRMRVMIGPGASKVVITPTEENWKVDKEGARYFLYDLSVSSVLHEEGSIGSFWQLTRFQSWKNFQPNGSTVVPIGTRKVQTFSLAKVKTNGRMKCLLIGINYKGSRSPLKGCVNDVFKMRNLLLRNGVRDDDRHLMLLIDDEFSNGMTQASNTVLPTKENILKGLQWLIQGSRAGDVLFLHFSGHGSQEKDLSGIEVDGFNETILPCDYETEGMITDDIIWSAIVYPLLDGVKLVTVMDSCHSGTVLDLPYDYDYKLSKWKEDLNPCHSAGDVIQFSGCTDDQYSDTIGTKRYNAGGAMTNALLAVLNQNASPTYEELLQQMTTHLRQQGFKQAPQLTASQRFNAKDKLFSLRDGIEPNSNDIIGRVVRKKIKENKSVFRHLACSKNRDGRI